jgi:hypothetical protein
MPRQDAVPAGALRVVQRAFGADAQAQVAGGAGAQTRVFRLIASAERSMAPAAARAYASLVSRNPYVIDLGRARDGSWQIRQAAAQQPGSGI